MGPVDPWGTATTSTRHLRSELDPPEAYLLASRRLSM